jgi:broad specificity phosphatase PhoE
VQKNTAGSVFNGWSDAPLDKDGQKSAGALGRMFSSIPLDHVYSSDIPRAQQTAESITPSAVPDPSLRAWNVGAFTGKPKEKFMSKMRPFIDNPEKLIPRGQSLDDYKSQVGNRLASALDEARQSRNPTLMVTHGSWITAAHSALDPSRGNDGFLHDSEIDHGGVAAVLDDGSFRKML